MLFPRKKIISLEISLIKYRKALEVICNLAYSRQSSYACFANVHMLVEAYKNKHFEELVNKADFVFADGVPLKWSLKLLYGIKQERVAGMDFMEDIVFLSISNNLKIFLYGSTTEILSAIEARIKKDYQANPIVGSISPPFREQSEKELNEHIQQINDSGANIILVALGCPKQEIWMAQNSCKIKGVCLGVGGAFPVFAKKQSRAPKFMQKYGLEWLYRLLQEPKRLWKRYLTTNLLFLYLILKQKLVGKDFL